MASGQQKAQQNLDAFMQWQDVHVVERPLVFLTHFWTKMSQSSYSNSADLDQGT